MSTNFAILAPVPLQHLVAGLDVLKSHPYIAYGSTKYELFLKIDELRNGQDVPMLIYPSHEADEVKLSFRVAWTGWYTGFVQGEKMRADEWDFRPLTCKQNKGDDSVGWPLFWHICDLRQLPHEKCVPISQIDTLKGYWRKNYSPRGPEIVARPEWI